MGSSLFIRGSLMALSFLLFPFSLSAQTSITNNDGGTSTTGNLYEAVTFENGPSGGGSVTLDISGSNSVTLQQALPNFSPSVTFYGTLGTDMAITVFGENDTEAALSFQQTFGLDSGVTFGVANDATGGLGQLDASVTAVGLSMGVSSALEMSGADMTTEAPITGNAAGGNATMVFSAFTLSPDGDFLNLQGGSLIFTQEVTGDALGGSASMTLGALDLSGNNDVVNLWGGDLYVTSFTSITGNAVGGGAIWSSGSLNLNGTGDSLALTGGFVDVGPSGSQVQGNSLGGVVSIGYGSINLTGSGDLLDLTGGYVDCGLNSTLQGAVGGSAYLNVGGLTLSGTDGSVSVRGGILQSGGTLQANGTGGAASVSINSLTLSGTNNNLIVEGGDSVLTGTVNGNVQGGSASVSAGAVTLTGAGDNLAVMGGALSDSAAGAGTMAAGDASLTADSVTMSAGTTLSALGGTVTGAGTAGTAAVSIGDLTGSGVVTLDGATAVLQVDTGSYGGVIAGNESLQKVNPGALTLSGANSYSGGTTIYLGTLDVDSGGALGTGGITNGDTLNYINNALAGSNTILNIATLSFSNNASANTASVTNMGLVYFNDSSVAGSAKIVNGISGSLIFQDSSSALDASILNADGAAATAQFNDQSTAGNSSITNGATDTLSFNDSSSAGSAFITNRGLLGFSGTNGNPAATAGNATLDNDGTISFDAYSSAGNAQIITNAGATLLFQGGASGGTARLITNSGGSSDFSGEGSALVTVGSIAGSGDYELGSVNLTVGVNNINTDVSGVISDGGASGGTGGFLTKNGTGTLTLSGNNSYSGGTLLLDGTLLADSTQALGTGSVTLVGGTLALDGPRLLDIGGNYTQNYGTTLQLGLAGIGPGEWDRLNVGGLAYLGGTLSLTTYSAMEFHDQVTYTLLTGNSLAGVFNFVQDSWGGAVSVLYQGQEVLLEVMADAPSFTALGTTPNQKAVGGALDFLAGQPADPALIDALDRQPDASLPGIYDQISPASLTPLYRIGFTTAQAEAGITGQRLSQLLGYSLSGNQEVSWNGEGPEFAGNLPAGTEAEMAAHLKPQRWGAFADGMGNLATVTSDGNGPGYAFDTGGVVAGMDYRFSKGWAGGLLLAYNQSSISQSTATLNVTGGQAGFYSGWKEGGWHLDALALGGVNHYGTQRQALGGTASGSAQGQQYSGSLSTGYEWDMGGTKVGPFLSGQYSRVNLQAFNETGSLAPLQFGAQGESYLDSDLGISASRKWDLGDATLSPHLKLGWEHLYQGNLDSLSSGLGSGGNFTVKGPALGTDAALVALGADVRFDKSFSAFAAYQGRLGLTNYSETTLTGGVNLGF